MTLPPPSLESLLSELAFVLTPSEAHLRAAEAAARQLSGGFFPRGGEHWRFEGVIPFGSSSRGTAVAPLKDCDRILCFRRTKPPRRGVPTHSAREFLDHITQQVRQMLVAAGLGQHWQVREQNHSVGLIEVDEHLSVDLVPAMVGPGTQTLWLPERSTDQWITACPHAMRLHLCALHAHQPHLLESIRLLKSWRRAQGIHFTSYAIEVLQARLAAKAKRPLLLIELLQGVFLPMAHAHHGKPLTLGRRTYLSPASLRDPWTGANVLSSLTASHRHALIEAARRALRTFAEAERRARTAPHDARRLLQTLFIGSAAAAIRVRHTHFEPTSPWFQDQRED